MNKIVIDIKEKEPENGDIIVFNSKTNSWEQTSKKAFINEILGQIKDLKTLLEQQEQEIQTNKENVVKLAKILKENI